MRRPATASLCSVSPAAEATPSLQVEADRIEAYRLLLVWFSAGSDDPDQLMRAAVELHVRHDIFPGDEFMRLAVDALTSSSSDITWTSTHRGPPTDQRYRTRPARGTLCAVRFRAARTSEAGCRMQLGDVSERCYRVGR